ncbi:MAG: acetate-CoA ligase subunit beta [Candidatus Methanoperedens nitroreducens]|uniref:acetate--CoA ligase (ADP-forming) n=1 Tax=Candidatus Methanoperedens nitratireducens TaxID=1392998 RepID=A0A0P7ZK71_9EURY|nr:bifunctional acetate--CoA ligase family protein/GNAT family N-acetyltransferase [Candidatus Methanoperedens sp. BLZ2]KPQ44376.1 MAG: acetate-CoA ligase subunit beta [Candidatus Methanoperedens sp. BLZ1]MBZ0174916.1 bifunctional acetate--CoA ligase family protein/GNAT family N-acetyltransferase [Candidatus Methanoperedens nitroreducens]MCX9079750.1 bifunctional acetate--CoA ligase family protein/GNAT family N-acetyltransferase [Candidatus Methanoperedens sp.]
MVSSNLDSIFNPKSIALVGASDEEGSVGYILMKNLTEMGYNGIVYPVNIHKPEILGKKAYPGIPQLPQTVDLAIIATPAATVPDIVEQCGIAGIRGLIIISAGFKEVGKFGKLLEEKIIEIKKKYGMRIIGPNCLGIIHPDIGLNATFISKKQKTGSIAFISQSGALGSAILDLAAHENINFSNFVSVGSMIDVNFGDLIDYFGTDPKTRSILMYIEGITDARKFMSAARHFSRTKPIIVVKSGRSIESAKAAASHTGAITGEDMVYDAAFKRAGIVRVKDIADLFNCAEAIGKQPLPKGPNLAIITNAGGPGVMASDSIVSLGGKLAQLSSETIEKLNSVLPSHWSKGNPIDLLGDANALRYVAAAEACFSDENVDCVLIIYTPQGSSDPSEIAVEILDLYKNKKFSKPYFTSFMGYEDVEKANRILTDNGVPTYSTPEQAVSTYMYMYQYKRNLELLYETPVELPVESTPPKQPLASIIRNAAKENRKILTETESKRFLEYYNIPIVKTRVAKTVDEAITYALQTGYPVALKILSPQISHKTDVGGVRLDINSEPELRSAYEEIMKSVKEHNPDAQIQGITVQKMVRKKGIEIILGAKTDSLFGPVVMFGRGGIDVEIYKDVAIGLLPLNQTLARRMLEETKVYRLLKGYRNLPPANINLLEEIVVRFSQMLVDFPQLKEFEINPLLINENDAFALDARGVIDKELLRAKPHEHLVISPYPEKYRSLWKLRDGRTVILRPIKPEDEPLWIEMFRNFSQESIHFRLFQTVIGPVAHEYSARYCNIDYDRELAIVAEIEDEGKRKMLGVVRLNIDPAENAGELSFIVADPWQGQGLGSKMVDYMIEICRDKQLEKISAVMLSDNYRAIKLFQEMGFTIESLDDGTQRAVLDLKEEIS